MERNKELELKIANLPESPGCYLMKHQGEIIYVGKAVNLKNRVRSYFRNTEHTPKVAAMVAHVDDFDILLCQTNLEALMLECNLIKRHRPFYNILLMDDKQYPYIRLDMEDPFPRLTVARREEKDGARYFGPYLGTGSIRQALDAVGEVFPLRTCKKRLPLKSPCRPCVNYEMGRCLGPCGGKCTEEEYRRVVQDVTRVLSGKGKELNASLKKEMEVASAAWDFEKAAAIRDKLRALAGLEEKQRAIQATGSVNCKDMVSMATDGLDVMVQVLMMRDGKMIAGEHYALSGEGKEPPEEVLTDFLLQYYDDGGRVPRQVLTEKLGEEGRAVLEQYLREKRGGAVELLCPQRGENRALLELTRKNAKDALEKRNAHEAIKRERTLGACEQLAKEIGLEKPPRRIEGYDISNTQGVFSIGAMVVFINGEPAKKEYRQFRIRTVEGPNDFASMYEVLTRRFAHAKRERLERAEKGLPPEGGRFSDLPDVILIDGGPGQLGYAVTAMEEAGFSIPMFSLAERLDEIFLPGVKGSIYPDRHSTALYLIQQVRDEAHRFGITAHRALRTKEGIRSSLEDIPGIGPKRRTALIRHFHSMSAIREASVEELLSVSGMNEKAARAIYAWAGHDVTNASSTEQDGEQEESPQERR